MMSSAEELTLARSIAHQGEHILFFIGAGLSAASGIKTFRDGDGWYQDQRVETLANIESFFSQRKIMLSWYQHRRNQLKTVIPNAGHEAIAKAAGTKRITVVTQNVDDLLERAQQKVGTSCPVWHLHGAIAEVKCHDCGNGFSDLDCDLALMPECDRCGGPLRPGVVWFGEGLPPEPLEESFTAAQKCDVCILVGTSGVVYPAAMVPEQAASTGAKLIEVNPNPSALSSICDVALRGPAHEVLPSLLQTD